MGLAVLVRENARNRSTGVRNFRFGLDPRFAFFGLRSGVVGIGAIAGLITNNIQHSIDYFIRPIENSILPVDGRVGPVFL